MSVNIFIATASIANWGSASNWSLGTVPSVNGDLIIFTSSSGTCSLNTNYSCSYIDFTNYDKRFSMSGNLSVYGDLTYGNKMSFSASSTRYIEVLNPTGSLSAISNIKSNGLTLSSYLVLNTTPIGGPASTTYSINDNFNVIGTFSITGNTDCYIDGTSSVYFYNGGKLALANASTKNGVVNFIFTGTSSISDTSSGTIASPITITAGNSTVTLSSYLRYGGSSNATFSYYSGKLTAFKFYVSNPVRLYAPGSTSSNLLPITFDSTANAASSDALYLSSDVYVVGGIDKTSNALFLSIRNNNLFIYGGTLNLNQTGVYTYTNESNIFIYGTNSTSYTSINCSGGSWLANNLTINTPGAVYINRLKIYNQSNTTNTFNYIAGNISYAGTFEGGNNITLNVGSIYWNNLIFSNTTATSVLINLTQPLVGKNISITSNSSDSKNYFTGSYGFSVSTFNSIPSAAPVNQPTLYLKAGVTYSVENSVQIISDLRSDTSNSKAKLIVTNGSAPQYITAQNVLDIDSSGGATIWYPTTTTATRTLNWNALPTSARTLTNLSTTGGTKNLADYVWNVIDDRYVKGSASSRINVANTGGVNTYLTTTFSGGGSVSHIAVKLNTNGGSSNTSYNLTGTFFLGLSSVTASGLTYCVAGSTISFDAASLPFYPNYSNSTLEYEYTSAGSYYNSWIVFKLPKVISLTASQYQLFYSSNTTVNNNIGLSTTTITGTSAISSFLVKTATASRTPSDDLILSGEFLGTNSTNSYTITMNATSSTDIYNNITIAPNATLTYVTASSYNPWLSLNSDILLYGGNLTIGSTNSSIPTSSIARLQFNGSASYPIIGYTAYNGDSSGRGIYMRPGGNLIAYGYTFSYSVLLAASASIGSSTLSVANVTNWSIGDKILVAPTEAYNQTEYVTITNITGTTISISGTLSYSHVVEGAYAPHVLNMTRNIRFIGNTAWSGYGSFILPYNAGVIDLNGVNVSGYGNTIFTSSTYTKNQFGIYIPNSYLKYDWNYTKLKYSSFDNVDSINSHNINWSSSIINTNLLYDNNIFYKTGFSIISGRLSATYSYNPFYYDNTATRSITSSNIFITNNFYIDYKPTIYSPSVTYYGGVTLGAVDIIFTGNTFIGMIGQKTFIVNQGSLAAGHILYLGLQQLGSSSGAYANDPLIWLGNYSNNTFYCNYSGCFWIQSRDLNLTGNKISNLNFWKNNLSFVADTGLIKFSGKNTTFDSLNAYKNTGGYTIFVNQATFNIKITNSTFSNPSNTYGLYFNDAEKMNINFENCYFSHSTADIYLDSSSTAGSLFGTPASPNIRMILNNTTLTAPTTAQNIFNMNNISYIKANKLNGVTGSYTSWYRGGVLTRDTSASYSISGSSVRATPNTILALNGITSITGATATNSGIYLVASKKTVPVFSNSTLNVSVYVRKSASTDGAAYNGSQPRLMIGLNTLIGFNNDTLLKTGTTSNGVYEIISATCSFIADGVADIWVECNGSSGWINVDEWNLTYT